MKSYTWVKEEDLANPYPTWLLFREDRPDEVFAEMWLRFGEYAVRLTGSFKSFYTGTFEQAKEQGIAEARLAFPERGFKRFDFSWVLPPPEDLFVLA